RHCFFSSRRRHTSFSRDWSSDVCSSDLIEPSPSTSTRLPLRWRTSNISVLYESDLPLYASSHSPRCTTYSASGKASRKLPSFSKIGRASCRERVRLEVLESALGMEGWVQ